LAGRSFTWEPKKYCEQLDLAKERIEFYAGKKTLPIFRAPGGKTSPKLLEEAEKCGYKHVGWAPAALEPLIVGLKEKGFCFNTLRQHPAYKDWIAAKGG
jgi:peptidoglycan/xylan/chitin deacetylase (PgdA/CDA1 family)